MKSTQAMRERARELATPPRDDFDRAVLYILDDFDALRAAASTSTEGARETAWLIERVRYDARPELHMPEVPPRWWRSLVRGRPATIHVVDATNDNEWTSDANEAIRFARQIDAEDFIKALDLPPSLMKATEHVWVS